MKGQYKFWLLLSTVGAVTTLEIVALLNGINGAILSSSFALLGTLFGIVLKSGGKPPEKGA